MSEEDDGTGVDLVLLPVAEPTELMPEVVFPDEELPEEEFPEDVLPEFVLAVTELLGFTVLLLERFIIAAAPMTRISRAAAPRIMGSFFEP